MSFSEVLLKRSSAVAQFLFLESPARKSLNTHKAGHRIPHGRKKRAQKVGVVLMAHISSHSV